jgi:hypothetical protein
MCRPYKPFNFKTENPANFYLYFWTSMPKIVYLPKMHIPPFFEICSEHLQQSDVCVLWGGQTELCANWIKPQL